MLEIQLILIFCFFLVAQPVAQPAQDVSTPSDEGKYYIAFLYARIIKNMFPFFIFSLNVSNTTHFNILLFFF